MQKFIFLFCFLLFLGCQHQPTKILHQDSAVATEGQSVESLMSGQPVILDVRPAFEFNLAHVPGAINVRWEDFSQTQPSSRGLLQSDLFSVARRLSLIGIDPQSKILVLGKGRQGQGEEGRVAWTLKVLGVESVHTLLHTVYRERNPVSEAPPVQNKSYWKPQVNEDLRIDFSTFKKQMAQKNTNVVVFDVRSPPEFSLRNLSQMKNVHAKVLNIFWQDFFTDKALPRRDIVSVLEQQGLKKESSIVVISNHGVRSGAVVYALQVLGFKNVRNFAGGYEQWK